SKSVITGGEIEKVISQLECSAQVQTKATQRQSLHLVRITHDRADFAAGTEKICSLAFEHVEVIRFGNICPAKQGELQQLAFSHFPCDSGEDIQDWKRTFSEACFEGRHV